MKVLLLTQDIHGKGGVGNYFKILKPRLKNADYLINGSRLDEAGIFASIRRFYADYVSFLKCVDEYDLVHINTSMRPKSLVRDAIFALLCSWKKKRSIVFIHGWNEKMASVTEKYLLWLYRWCFFRTDAFIVLAEQFKRTLEHWGYKGDIFLLTTLVDDDLIAGFGEDDIRDRVESGDNPKILYLSRLEKEKGIYQTLDIFRRVLQDYPQASLTVAGDGSEFENAKLYVEKKGIANVDFMGFVRDKERIRVLKESDFYLFPTHYGEGMPTTILEAMAFGLPVITRPVGGIKDFFLSGKMGLLLDRDDADVAARYIIGLFKDRPKWLEIGIHNHRFIKQNMAASMVEKKLQSIYERTFSD